MLYKKLASSDCSVPLTLSWLLSREIRSNPKHTPDSFHVSPIVRQFSGLIVLSERIQSNWYSAKPCRAMPFKGLLIYETWLWFWLSSPSPKSSPPRPNLKTRVAVKNAKVQFELLFNNLCTPSVTCLPKGSCKKLYFLRKKTPRQGSFRKASMTRMLLCRALI